MKHSPHLPGRHLRWTYGAGLDFAPLFLAVLVMNAFEDTAFDASSFE